MSYEIPDIPFKLFEDEKIQDNQGNADNEYYGKEGKRRYFLENEDVMISRDHSKHGIPE
jgi:hypothetical protein